MTSRVLNEPPFNSRTFFARFSSTAPKVLKAKGTLTCTSCISPTLKASLPTRENIRNWQVYDAVASVKVPSVSSTLNNSRPLKGLNSNNNVAEAGLCCPSGKLRSEEHTSELQSQFHLV